MRVWWTAGACAVAFVAAGFVGCGGSDSSSGGKCEGGSCAPPGYMTECGDAGCWQPTADDQSYASQFCALTANCCLRLHDASPPVPTVADHQSACSSEMLSWGFSRDPQVRAACLADLAAVANDAECMPKIWPTDPSGGCARLFAEQAGRVALGGQCRKDSDCAGVPGSLSLCSAAGCRQLTPGKPGDACVLTVGAGTIEPVFSTQVKGKYCSEDDGYICRPNDATSQGYCVPTIADGKSCLYDYDCDSLRCVNDDDGGYTCFSPPPPNDLPDGASCSNHGSCKSRRCSAGICMARSQAEPFILFCAP